MNLVQSHTAPTVVSFSPNLNQLSGPLSSAPALSYESSFLLPKLGDVVWDLAVGEEGNAGRLIWDGSYLIVSFLRFMVSLHLLIVTQDLDYTYSPIGDLPKYVPGPCTSIASYVPALFPQVLQAILLLGWTYHPEELKLLQDRVRTVTSQGSYHNVVRWVHRSPFHLRIPRS